MTVWHMATVAPNYIHAKRATVPIMMVGANQRVMLPEICASTLHEHNFTAPVSSTAGRSSCPPSLEKRVLCSYPLT